MFVGMCFSADSLSFKLPKSIEATKSRFPKKIVKNTFQTRDRFTSAPLNKIVVKAHKTKGKKRENRINCGDDFQIVNLST